LAFIGGAAAWPLAARAQQSSMPLVGFLTPTSPDTQADRLRAFRQGLKENGFVEGENVAIAYRWAENQTDRVPELVADLVQRNVTVIATVGDHVALAAKTATTTIPIVFVSSEDPVRLGLVNSLARPGGNMTGVNIFVNEVVAKRLELLRELVPGVARVAVLVNRAAFPNTIEVALKDIATAASTLGLQVQVINANTGVEIDAAFSTLVRERPDAVFVSGAPLFTSQRVQLVLLATRHAIPATYAGRQFPEIGGLMSYGANLANAWRQVGLYAGHILKGAKPAELPVVQASKLELVINAQAAKVLGLTVPPQLLARADEVIE
jgi:putative tryptophan/tyrosine transport system substrate-binding protein